MRKATFLSRVGILLGVTQAPTDHSDIPSTDDLSAVAFGFDTIQASSSLLGSFQAFLRSGDQREGEDPKS